ncbi:LysR family transcriptional regulator [Aureimonas pseudogalii]|uniref:DNA-binding transcriptional LysR family regulator n=1 Tax=Aureimonas pseudogalii TaxID=1744844 RepID=A0A7W6MMH7_9HYPH|nr:LysR family transcriptional regulator [Aureimonas pseudogalii]MBB4000858.1 DNA-binding transcriptional LysR family regulator [Aureimonas pseudogalii]
MGRDELGDLLTFVAVAEESSFTRAAARLGISQSALSQGMRRIETRYDIRLVTRSTRIVSLTTAGVELLRVVAPALAEIQGGLSALGQHRERPASSFRITAGEHAVENVLWPKLAVFLRDHPDIKVELSADATLHDIVAERYDAGVRLMSMSVLAFVGMGNPCRAEERQHGPQVRRPQQASVKPCR